MQCQWFSKTGSTELHRWNQCSCKPNFFQLLFFLIFTGCKRYRLYSQIVPPGKLPSTDVCVNVPLCTPGHVPENDTVYALLFIILDPVRIRGS